MVILESPPIVSEVLAEFDIKDEAVVDKGEEVAHWFYGVPCAGVKYYSFERRPAPPAPVKQSTTD